ncbi:class I SAM-dependent methyltransferase [Rhodococcus oxybenzonivorans]|uniref:class I SAM-dependent methyltransferase n=1 Tax=Rhodococcus TaxID=1827 RepID=UPI00131F6772|nr:MULTISPECIES: class I SAM-dependent methyltransferase [Rhodococcus]MDV7355130.1 class I SAM-dependent methyltransferase [Rhodococcus oxybenzonivorans]QHE69067.1 Methyltransferase [Rhodococcus sp. WAY2]
MGLGQRLLGGSYGHADHSSGGLIRRARLYEWFSAVGFGGFRRRVFDGLVALSGAKPGDEVLDIGCGTGIFSRRAARVVRPGGRVVGIDPSPPMIEYAARRALANCTFVIAGAEDLPQPDASFDLVISSLAIHHIPTELRAKALAEAFRVLRPGGRLLIADFRPPRNRIASHLVGAVSGHAMQHNPIHELAGSVRGAGFVVTGSGDRWPRLHYIQATRP